VVLLALEAGAAGVSGVSRAADEAGFDFFERNVRPLLVERCYGCHSANAKKLRGGLLLDTREGWMEGGDSGPAIEPGDPEASLLLRAVRYESPDLQMPPKGKLSEEEIRILVEWVAKGAPDPRESEKTAPAPSAIDIEAGRRFWSFQRPVRPPVPPVSEAAVPDGAVPEEGAVSAAGGSWCLSDIDRFILARLEGKGLKPVGDADRRTLIRRASFDLTGLPPAPEDVEAFLADESPEAFAKVVDRLLASERFGERWGRHWLDIARYAESTGKTRNFPYPHAWRYRDYVIDALNADKPYDRFIAEQIAGDLLPATDAGERNEQRIATGLLALGPKDLNERNNAQYTMDNVDEQIDTVTRSVLALTVSCARCHDHKFDPIPTQDYYALAGIFRSTEILVGLGNRQGAGNRYQNGALVRLEGGAAGEAPAGEARAEREARIAALEKERAAAEREVRRLRQAAAKGAGGGEGAVDGEGEGEGAAKKKKRRPPADAAARKRLAELRATMERLTKELDQLVNEGADGGLLAVGVRDAASPGDSRIHVRGDVANLGASVPRGFIRVLSGDGAPEIPVPEIPASASGRLELARWLSSPENPLTARVMVNRIWHHLFGRGLVRTVDNFGATGEVPTHPELLDHLALQFVEGGWSVKGLIRAIVLSRVYRLASDHDAKSYEVDPANLLLWRRSQRRLEAEAFRDAILAVSGSLDGARPDGSPVARLEAAEVGRRGDAFFAGESRHRSVYLPIVRGFVPGMLEAFDFAEPSMVQGERDVTTVATQALYLLNSPFVIEESRRTAARLLEAEGLDDAGRVRQAYEWALGRPALPEETERGVEHVARRGAEGEPSGGGGTGTDGKTAAWAGFCQALFASAEFRYVN
jgi:hypothetical protein